MLQRIANSRLGMISRQLSTSRTSSISTKSLVNESVKDSPITFTERVGLKTFSLNRPKALNALNQEMMILIKNRIKEWDSNPSTGVILSSGVGKAYCAGGDVKSIALNPNKDDALNILKDEFELDHQLAVLTKPYVALMDGYTMGGGAGISLPAPIRVSTDNTVFAFPETRLGYAPDVGASYYLSRLDGQLGAYLSLTGNSVSGIVENTTNVISSHLGLSTHHVSPSLFPALVGRLSDLSSSPVTGSDVNSVIDEFTTQPLPKLSETLMGAHRQAIDDAFGQSSVEEIIQVLENFKENRPEVGKWAAETLETLYDRPPTSLKVALEAVRRGVKMHNVAQALQQELTFANQFIYNSDDFRAGVTAVLVNKTKEVPQWQPNNLKDIRKNDVIGSYFTTTENTSDKLEIRNEKKPLYDFFHFALPTEREIEDYIRGSHPASGNNAVRRNEALTFFKTQDNAKYGVTEKVNEVIDRCTIEEKGGYLKWR
ncbi:ClpP/crotonase [Wallemia mellicola]|nr:ClpP/crotonase [Wallemia mellicola]TIB91680.1 ClpP/crotonase [Wallemia mellicola]TIC21150.1 ClpP/crotonase [Wallemia mellicola]TIC38559.1 ClpP/crotonase [Wallemia mellicola]TIC44024.1 ClpP/crotonase [Wallemia mellicola]